jgi:hypothetical protein
MTAAKAYVAVGFSERNANSNANRLIKDERIKARIEHLRLKIEEKMLEAAIVDRKWVTDLLKRNALAALAEGDRSAVNRAAELLGKDLGMFRDSVDHSFQWDGDLTKLTWQQLLKLQSSARQLEGGPCFDIVPEVQP